MTGAAVDSGWMGTFSPVSLSTVLKRVSNESRTGDLQVVSGNRIKTIRVEKGTIRFATSNLREDRLGESMLSHECISPKDFRAASERMREDGCRFGEALLKMGRLDRKRLHRELGVQVQRIVLSLFRLSDGLYSFEETSGVRPRLPFSLAVPPLLLKGLRRVPDGRVILEALPHADTLIRIAERPACNIPLEKLAAVERSVLERAGAGTPLGDIVRSPGLERSAALRSCYGLLTVGLLEVVGDGASAATKGATGQPPMPPAEESASRELIESQYTLLEQASDLDLLGVPRDASTEDLHTAYEALSKEWTEVRRETWDGELVSKLDAIEGRLARAYRNLISERETDTPTPAAPAPSAARSPEDLAKDNRIEQLERDAKLHLQVKDWRGALSLLYELVALAPGNASYQLMLGQAMQHEPQQEMNAEAHFLEAVRLSPRDPKTHAGLVRHYQRMKKPTQARRAAEKLLAIDPGNETAKRLLNGVRPPTRMKRLLKKLFH